jgi:hypothetical protein
MDEVALYAALLRKMKARKRRKPAKASHASHDNALGKAVKIGTIGKWKTDRTGRKGFYHVKNVRGVAVLMWKPYTKKKKSRRLI